LITEPIYSYLAALWLNTGFDLSHGAPGAAFRTEPTLNRLREVINRTLTDFSLTREPTGGTAPKVEGAVPARPASVANAETRPANDPHRRAPPDRGSQAIKEPGSSNKPGTAAMIQVPALPGDRPEGNIGPPPRRKLGRPTEIPDELKQKALGVQGGKARAQILYQNRYPSSQQVKPRGSPQNRPVGVTSKPAS
jgi:hypothetical protein